MGRGVVGLVVDDFLDTVGFREVERVGLYRKVILVGSRVFVEIGK